MAEPSIVQRDAEWATQFRNATSSLAQRNRYEEMRREGARETERIDESNMEQAIQRDPKGLGKLMLDRQRERRLGFQAEDARGFRERQFGFQKERALNQQELAKKRFDMDETKAWYSERKAIREMEETTRVNVETDALEARLFNARKNNIMPGSEAYAQEAMKAVLENPYAKPDLKSAALRDAFVEADPTQLTADFIRRGGKHPKLSLRQNADGRDIWGVSQGAEPSAPKPEKDTTMSDYKEALALSKDESLDPAEREFWKKKKGELFGKIQSPPAPAETPPAAGAPVEEMVAVIAPDGTNGKILKSKLDAAISKGYKAR